MTLLFVCDANVCRSVLAQMLVRTGTPQVVRLRVESAGLRADPAAVTCYEVSKLSGRLGTPTPMTAARKLTSDMLTAAALIVTMTVPQREEIRRLRTGLIENTFTLGELTAILTAVPPKPLGLSELIEEAHHHRYLVGTAVSALNIPDGHHGGRTKHRKVLRQVQRQSAELARQLALRSESAHD